MTAHTHTNRHAHTKRNKWIHTHTNTDKAQTCSQMCTHTDSSGYAASTPDENTEPVVCVFCAKAGSSAEEKAEQHADGEVLHCRQPQKGEEPERKTEGGRGRRMEGSGEVE